MDKFNSALAKRGQSTVALAVATLTIGFLAAAFTLLAFVQTAVVPMRLAALGANLSFIAYGVLAACQPVLILHVVLLPVNTYRLWMLLDRTAPVEPGRSTTQTAGWTGGLI